MTHDSSKLVEEVMSRDVATLEESDLVLHLLDTMKAMKFRHMPVVDEDRLIGLLSERDVLALSASNLLPHADEQDKQLQARTRVADVMVTELATVSPKTPLIEAARLMLDRRLGCLPVVDEHNALVGILTSSDLVAVVARRK